MTCEVTIPKYSSKIWEVKQIYVLPLKPCDKLHKAHESTGVGRYFESGDGMIDVVFLWIPAT